MSDHDEMPQEQYVKEKLREVLRLLDFNSLASMKANKSKAIRILKELLE